jgi:hypothetical protein
MSNDVDVLTLNTDMFNDVSVIDLACLCMCMHSICRVVMAVFVLCYELHAASG